ncbi:hypothetical protein QC589_00510 [Halomonas elongata]|uniref:hypothetical protein n=1 Tax=Halomonas elongata TaxID=2746 RepID=UPI0033543022
MANTAEIFQFPPSTRRQPRVRSWRINEIEEEALIELPPEVERLYQHGIRKHMDYATGITGRKRRVSMDMFREVVDYHPPAGSREKARIHSRQQITRMLDKLEAAGLIERLHRGKGVKAAMEFRLPLACSDLDEHRAESDPTGTSRKNPHSRASGEANTEQGANREERSTSGSPVTPLSPDGESVDAQQARPKRQRRQWGEPVDHELTNEMVAAVSADLEAPVKHNPDGWANEFRLMRQRDGRTVEQIRYLISWTAEHHFWSSVVLSPKKLRDKWDQLAKQVRGQRKPATRQDGRLGMAQPQPQGSYTPTDMDNLPDWMRD